ncbi:membrane protein insertase YidC [Ectobacillus ponti]|uniref:Membrane protein insertase YidC n=1 Tax=Ectobacillus ponti TaxID=2961894 RepID=A0AA41X9M7_9BACI|nr:membrane protein insertase YidC [Ectobacillus ponti]MCP8969244.1 membrane protein insertase YidC [Ectobacillus ponti]
MNQKQFSLAGLGLGLLLLAGCSSQGAITPQSSGLWNHYFVYPISYVITEISSWCGDNYGIGIIVMTLLIRLVLAPLAVYLNDNSVKMRELQPQLKKLREQYGANDREAQQKMTQEMTRLYRENGVHPMMGCLPAVIQMFILMALYNAIVRTKVIAAHSFLWFSLGQVDPLHVLPVLAALATFLQYAAISKASHTGDNPAMQQQMKVMKYVMPVFIFFTAFHLAAAIGLYWVVGNTWMALQALYMERRRQRLAAAAVAAPEI